MEIRYRSEEVEIIKAKAENGYTGKIILHNNDDNEPRFELFAYMPDGSNCIHSWSSNVKNYDELCEFLHSLPEFFED